MLLLFAPVIAGCTAVVVVRLGSASSLPTQPLKSFPIAAIVTFTTCWGGQKVVLFGFWVCCAWVHKAQAKSEVLPLVRYVRVTQNFSKKKTSVST